MVVGRCIQQVWIFLCERGINITFWFSLLNTITRSWLVDILQVWTFEDWYHSLVCSCYYRRLHFSENIVNFRHVQIFLHSWCFSYRNDETQTQNLLIRIWKPNFTIQVSMAKTFILPSRNQLVLSSSLITMIQVYAIFRWCTYSDF